MSDRLARLVIQVQGGGATAELPRSGVLLVGSDRDKVGLYVDGQGVASVHCAIARARGGGWALKDLGAEFGVQVNGKSVTSQRLALGDVILLGSRRLTILDPAQESAPPTAEAPASIPHTSSASAPTGGSTSESVDPPQVPRASTTNGDLPPVLGGYRLLRSLGRGGTGQVYLALQESLNRQVALKVLDGRHEMDRVFVARFQEEARAAAALSHPNVVTVYDVGAHAGHHYLSMEYMAGGDLEGWLAREGPLPWRTLLDVLRDAASGLVFAESRGIVHRDIKPANLMRDDHGVVKIADLGLATQVEAKETSSEGRRLFGTPHFIAPEIVRGEHPDARSDLYSLGATAYRLLTGHTPFEGASATEILRGALHGSFTPVSEQVPGVPAGLTILIERLLERDPAQRPSSAQALLDTLERLRRGEGLHPTPTAESEPSTIARPVLTAALVIAVGTAIIIGGRRLGFWGDAAPPVGDSISVDEAGGSTDPSHTDGPTAPTAAGAPGSETATAVPSPPAGETDGAPDVELEPVPADDLPGPPLADDDTPLKLLEEEARLAFLRLADRSLPAPERVLELRDLAHRFAGTSAAADALEHARGLEASIQADASVASGEARIVQEALALLRQSAALNAVPPQPATALAAVAALETGGKFPVGDAFLLRRNAILVSIIDRAIDYGEQQLRLADEAAQGGRYEDRRSILDEYLAGADLPTPETWPAATPTPGPAASDLARLEQVADAARLALVRVDYDASVFLYERERRDAGALAGALGGAQGLQAELRTLALELAATRLDQAAAQLEAPDLQARVSQWATDVRAAAASFVKVADGYLDPGWRIAMIRDPRARGKVTRAAVGADAAGVRVRKPDGTIEVIPWSAYGSHTDALRNLFHKRLDREWSSRERHDIANLLTICAVGEALAGAEEMFRPQENNHFSDGEARSMLAAFQAPALWAITTESKRTLEREAGAAEVLVDVLQSMDSGAYARAVAGTERLLTDFGDTLLVLSLADGREWRDPVPDPRLLSPPEMPAMEPSPALTEEPSTSPSSGD